MTICDVQVTLTKAELPRDGGMVLTAYAEIRDLTIAQRAALISALARGYTVALRMPAFDPETDAELTRLSRNQP